MRVPVYESPEVAPAPLPEARLNVRASPNDFGAQLGQGVDQLGGQLEDRVKKARDQARAMRMTQAEQEVQQGVNAQLYGGNMPADPTAGGYAPGPTTGSGGGPPAPAPGPRGPTQQVVVGGVMNTRGEASVAAAQDAYESLDELRQRVANKYFQNEEERKLFMMRTGGVAESAHRQIEEHVGHQIQAAKEATAQGLQETSLQAIANAYADPKARALYAAQPEGPIQALALSPEDAAAKLSAWRSKVASVVMNQYLDNQDPVGAQAYFAEARDALGPASAQYEQRLLTMKNQLAGAQEAGKILGASITENGQPDKAKIFVQLENMPEGKLKDDTRKALEQKLSLADAAYNQDQTQRLGRVVVGIEKNNGYLNESSQDYAMLSDDAKAKAQERAKTIQRQVRGSSNEERRQQADLNKIAITGAKDMEDADLVKLNPAASFPQADVATLNQIGALQKKAAARIQRGDTPRMEEFRGIVNAASEQMGFIGPQKQQAADLLANMVDWREKYLEKNGDKPPTRQEVDKRISEELTHTASHWYSGGSFRFQAERSNEAFVPGQAEDQKYAPAKAALSNPATPPAQIPATAAKPVTRTVNGVTKTWNGSKWVE